MGYICRFVILLFSCEQYTSENSFSKQINYSGFPHNRSFQQYAVCGLLITWGPIHDILSFRFDMDASEAKFAKPTK